MFGPQGKMKSANIKMFQRYLFHQYNVVEFLFGYEVITIYTINVI